jgi:hypothetical protein
MFLKDLPLLEILKFNIIKYILELNREGFLCLHFDANETNYRTSLIEISIFQKIMNCY